VRGSTDDVWEAIRKHRIATLATEEGGRLVEAWLPQGPDVSDAALISVDPGDVKTVRM
jgi:hypothetical protein